MTQQRLWLAFAVVAGVAFAIQLFRPADSNERPETTFDTAPRGHAAVFALLERFDATRGRWLSGLTMPSVEEPIWWISPGGACEGDVDSVSADSGEPGSLRARSPFEIAVRPWIEAGGTAIVWLSHPPLDTQPSDATPLSSSDETEVDDIREDWADRFAAAREEVREGAPLRCRAIAGFALPPRRLAGLEGGALPAEGPTSRVVFSVGRAVERREDFDYDGTRVLPGPTLAFFDPDVPPSDARDGWRPLWVEADDFTPLALERKVGQGRLVVVADARILSNGRLARVDSAPFVFDWVEAEGPPWIDEHAHGVVPESGTFRYLANSPAWAAGLGLLVLGMLVVWRGHAWPTRAVTEVDPVAPTLATFVDSVARLYSGTRDHARVFERYRTVCLDRIRRALGLAPGTEVDVLLASLRARAENWPELRAARLGPLLTSRLSISAAEDLVRNAARLDEVVQILRAGASAGKGRSTFEAAGAPHEKGSR